MIIKIIPAIPPQYNLGLNKIYEGWQFRRSQIAMLCLKISSASPAGWSLAVLDSGNYELELESMQNGTVTIHAKEGVRTKPNSILLTITSK